MRRWKAVLVVALGFAFLAGATVQAGSDGELVYEETYKMGRGGTLSLESGSGGVRIHGESRDDVLIQVRAEDMDLDDAKEMLDLEVRESGDGLEVVVELEERKGFLGWGGRDNGRVWIEVYLPHRSDVDIDNGSGGVTVEEIQGRVRIDNGSGGVKLEEIDGDVQVDNGSGGIKIVEIVGAVEVENGSGGIKVSRVRGDVSIENSSGGVKLEEIDGVLEIDNGSGGVKAEMVGRNQGITVESNSGGVVLEVPGDWGAELDLSSRSSHISVRGFGDLELEDAEDYKGSVGGGGPTISVRNGSGQVMIIAG